MKTAISIPDPVFEEAEDMAQSLGVSRSKFYTEAVVEFIAAHRKDGVTKALNDLYKKENSDLDPGLAKMQGRVLAKEKW